MYFQLIKLILWPRIDDEPRIVEFKAGVLNVISGASKTGKSAVIPIIDYCLGADKCAIPVGVIRENCAWFGIVINTLEGQKLLARREPGDQQATGDMILIEGPTVEIPRNINEKTHTVDVVKDTLNRLSGLTNLKFDPQEDIGYKSRPSFRDLMAFNFQPQNIVANPDVMFFKADTTEHREKLKTIFPYVLGAVTAEILRARYQLDQLFRLLRRKETELRDMEVVASTWRREAQSWIRKAIELGLISSSEIVPTDWPSIVDILQRTAASNSRAATPSIAGIDSTLTELKELREQETEVANKLNEHRHRLNELRRLQEGRLAYSNALVVQRDRLALADWLRQLTSKLENPLSILGSKGYEELIALCTALDGIEIQINSQPNLSDALDREMLRQRAATETVLVELTAIRSQLVALEQASEEARAAADKFDQIERFLGRLEQALQLYARSDQSSGIRAEISDLKKAIEHLTHIISEQEIQKKITNIVNIIQGLTSRMIPLLDAEWPDSPIRLSIPDLTVKVIRGTRDDFLWEIGSGANWLAYHVALTLALQKYFLAEVNHPVPALLIYDQPSQVYFPRRIVKRDDDEDKLEPLHWRDKEIEAVRKIFSLLASEVAQAEGRLQIIVLDHADEDVWGDIPNTELVEEWRDRALVPVDWINSQPS